MAGPQSISIGRDRLTGFLNANKKSGRHVSPSDIIMVDLTEKDGYEKFMAYLANNGTPDAVICVNDSVALGVYSAAAKLGINIPTDMAVIGYGKLHSGQLISPSLSTFDVPVKEMCYATVDLLVRLITNDIIKKKVIEFSGEIVIRDSI